MQMINLFNNISVLKAKLKVLLGHKKRLQALENYSLAVPFYHKNYLILIKKCMQDSFLGDKEADFLCYLTDKYFPEQNFIDWTHKTKWLKGEIARLNADYNLKTDIQLPLFDYEKKQDYPVPFEVIAQRQNFGKNRRAI